MSENSINKEFNLGDKVKLVRARLNRDKKYVGQFATIIDGAGFITDWLVKFGDGYTTGVNPEEIELL